MCLVTCVRANGYNRETLEIKYKDKNIHEVLEMTVEDAVSSSMLFRLFHVNC